METTTLVEAKHKPIFTRRIGKVGLEAEGFWVGTSGKESSCVGLATVAGTMWSDEAGLDQVELITAPCESVAEAVDLMRQTIALNRVEIEFVGFRPDSLRHNQNCWQRKQRYDALKAALYPRAVPRQAHLINHMTNWSALHVNVSGSGLDNDALVGAVDLFNDLGGCIAAVIHNEIGQGYGHPSIWSGFGEPERFPQYGRRFGTMEKLIRYFESVQRLIKVDENNQYSVCEGEYQSITNPYDLGVMWWLARPKLSANGRWYLEIRLAPSMPLAQAQKYAELLVDIVNGYLNWYYDDNKGQPVECRRSTELLYKFLHHYFPNYILDFIPTEIKWNLARYM